MPAKKARPVSRRFGKRQYIGIGKERPRETIFGGSVGGSLGRGGYVGNSYCGARLPSDRPLLSLGNGNLVGGFGELVSLGRSPKRKEA